MTWYYNGAGQCYELPERPLEPPDCWAPENEDEDDDLLGL